MRITAIFIFLMISLSAYAAPFQCSLNGGVFADSQQCAASCGAVKCDELTPAGSGSGTCDTSSYQGFFTVNGMTYALTKKPVKWDSVPTAAIRNALDNELITKMLAKFGVSAAWIGAHDPDKSPNYGVVDKSRFKWRDKSEVKYENWVDGQPDNKLDSSHVGVSPIYGEHWGVITASGKWNDIGLDSAGQHKLLPAIVEFSGKLSCVAGNVKDGSEGLSGMYCSDNTAGSDGLVKLDICEVGIIFDGNGATGSLCTKGKTACNKEQREIKTEKTEQLQGNIGYTGSCTGMNDDCNNYRDPQRKLVLSADNKTLYIQTRKSLLTVCGQEDGADIHCLTPGEWKVANEYSFPFPVKELRYTAKKTNEYHIDDDILIMCQGDAGGCPNHWDIFNHMGYLPNGELLLSDTTERITSDPSFEGGLPGAGFRTAQYITTLTVKYDEVTYKTVHLCPFSEKPCIENSGGYYCSPYDCKDAASSGVTDNDDEKQEGANDDNNDGKYDENGVCTGQVVIFPGKDMRCRLPSILTAMVGCCHEMPVADQDKPDIRISKEQVMGGIGALYLVGGPAYLWLMSLASIIDINICNGNEKQLGVNRGYNQCKYIGKYCAKKWDSQGCVQMKDTWCCFDSEFSRAFAEAGHDLLGKPWGTAENPLCTGFSPEELQLLSAMGLSDHPIMRQFAESLGAQYSEKLIQEFQQNLSPNLKQDIQKEIEGLKE